MCLNRSRLWVRNIFKKKMFVNIFIFFVISVVHSLWLFHDKEARMSPCWLCWAAVGQLHSHHPSSGVANGSFQLRCFIAFAVFFHVEWGGMSSTDLAVIYISTLVISRLIKFLNKFWCFGYDREKLPARFGLLSKSSFLRSSQSCCWPSLARRWRCLPPQNSGANPSRSRT